MLDAICDSGGGESESEKKVQAGWDPKSAAALRGSTAEGAPFVANETV